MSMIQIEHLTFYYPGSYDAVFEDVSFRFDTRWRLGLVGRNGRGKTTLLSLLQGKYPYRGQILHSTAFGAFPQQVAEPGLPTRAVLEQICPEAEEWRLLRELSRLEVEPGALDRPYSTLSGGEQAKVQLAALFCNEGQYLLIDEPTIHLDARGRALVAEYLRGQRGFLLISHDRRFLDGCVDHVLALNRASIELQSGSFSGWLERFEARQAAESAQNEQLRRQIHRMEQSARRTADWSDRVEASKSGAADRGYVGHKAAKMMKRAKCIEARQNKAIAEKSALLRDAEEAEALRLAPLPCRPGPLLTVQEAAVCYDGAPVCAPVSFVLRPGERIALEGANGSGKSSLLRLVCGQAAGHTGRVAAAPGLVVSYVPQDTGGLSGPLAGFAAAHGLDESRFFALLRKLGFARVQFEKDLAALSAGQKKKVLLARSLCERAHLYVWDEPLNFIDLYSRLQIERLVCASGASMLLVEHDRAFQEAAAHRVVTMRRAGR